MHFEVFRTIVEQEDVGRVEKVDEGSVAECMRHHEIVGRCEERDRQVDE